MRDRLGFNSRDLIEIPNACLTQNGDQTEPEYLRKEKKSFRQPVSSKRLRD